ncbi:hypothetical protein HanRHA438_Chr00c12g0849271 [Helianthus annuus]|nr:hypothetical protein HanRHA438_Chr00c12g0849271 [Helianthus annuus]
MVVWGMYVFTCPRSGLLSCKPDSLVQVRYERGGIVHCRDSQALHGWGRVRLFPLGKWLWTSPSLPGLLSSHQDC